MIVTHKIKRDKISKNIFNTIDRNLSMCLLNRRGHFFAVPVVPTDQLTNMNGWFNVIETNNRTSYAMYKSIDNIYINKININL